MNLICKLLGVFCVATTISACVPQRKTPEEVAKTREQIALKILTVGTTVISTDAKGWVLFKLKSSCYFSRGVSFASHNPGLIIPTECP